MDDIEVERQMRLIHGTGGSCCWPEFHLVAGMPCVRINLLGVGRFPMVAGEEAALRFTRRAEELRVIAANVKNIDVRDAMLRWAADYDRLAERAIETGTLASPPLPEPGSPTGQVRE